jgi:hypothetical protein
VQLFLLAHFGLLERIMLQLAGILLYIAFPLGMNLSGMLFVAVGFWPISQLPSPPVISDTDGNR